MNDIGGFELVLDQTPHTDRFKRVEHEMGIHLTLKGFQLRLLFGELKGLPLLAPCRSRMR
ncbi:hypothetical protein ACS72_15810 [Acinetobacter sp. VT 511]|nr:hypothetical protein ACS72_15810 [Acinetobacter sp. VT 511]